MPERDQSLAYERIELGKDVVVGRLLRIPQASVGAVYTRLPLQTSRIPNLPDFPALPTSVPVGPTAPRSAGHLDFEAGESSW